MGVNGVNNNGKITWLVPRPQGSGQMVDASRFKKALNDRETALTALRGSVVDHGALILEELFTKRRVMDEVGRVTPILDQDLADVVEHTFSYEQLRENFFEVFSKKMYISQEEGDQLVKFNYKNKEQIATLHDLAEIYKGIISNTPYSSGRNLLGPVLTHMIEDTFAAVKDLASECARKIGKEALAAYVKAGAERNFLVNTILFLVEESAENNIDHSVILRDLELAPTTKAKLLFLLGLENMGITTNAREKMSGIVRADAKQAEQISTIFAHENDENRGIILDNHFDKFWEELDKLEDERQIISHYDELKEEQKLLRVRVEERYWRQEKLPEKADRPEGPEPVEEGISGPIADRAKLGESEVTEPPLPKDTGKREIPSGLMDAWEDPSDPQKK